VSERRIDDDGGEWRTIDPRRDEKSGPAIENVDLTWDFLTPIPNPYIWLEFDKDKVKVKTWVRLQSKRLRLSKGILHNRYIEETVDEYTDETSIAIPGLPPRTSYIGTNSERWEQFT